MGYPFMNQSLYTAEQKEQFEFYRARRLRCLPPRIIFGVLCPLFLIAIIPFAVLQVPAGIIVCAILFLLSFVLAIVFSKKCRNAYRQMILIDKGTVGRPTAVVVESKPERGHIHCAQCGAQNDTEAKFCSSCGAPIRH